MQQMRNKKMSYLDQVGLLCFVSKLLKTVSLHFQCTVCDPHSQQLPAAIKDESSLYSSKSLRLTETSEAP